MKFDKTTMLVTDFEDIDTDKLFEDLLNWIYKCNKTDFLTKVMEEFRIQCGLNPDQFFMVQSNVFPIRILHSLIRIGYIEKVWFQQIYLD